MERKKVSGLFSRNIANMNLTPFCAGRWKTDALPNSISVSTRHRPLIA